MKMRQQPLLIAAGLIVPALMTSAAPTTFAAYDHPLDDGHGHRADPEDPPEPEEPEEEPNDPCNSTGSPVYLSSGDLVVDFQDLGLGLGLPIDVVRTYNSGDDRNGLGGLGWAHGFELRGYVTHDGVSTVVVLRWPTGQRHRFVRQPDGSYSKPLGCPVDLKATPSGFEVTRAGQYTYFLDSTGKPLSVADASGREATFGYDSSGCVNSISTPSGGGVDVVRGPNGKIASVTGPAGRTVSYEYDDSGQLVSVTNPLSETTSFVYEAGGRLVEVLDPLGRSTMSVTYDSSGRVSRLVDRTGDHSYVYGSGYTLKVNNSDGGTWNYGLDGEGVVTSVTNPVGNTRTMVYDGLYNLIRETDFTGAETNYEYDSQGNLTKLTGPDGGVFQYVYDDEGNRVQMVDALGVVTVMDYDADGNQTRTVQAAGLPEEREMLRTFDVDGNLLTETDFEGNATTYTYDSEGRVTSVTDPTGVATAYEYDAYGYPSRTTLPNGSVVEYDYDAVGRLLETRDGIGIDQSVIYDAAGFPTAVTGANGTASQVDYDQFGRLSSLTSSDGGVWSYEFGPHGPTIERDPIGGVSLTEYDLAGRVTSTVVKVGDTSPFGDFNDFALDYVLDGEGRPVQVRLPLQSPIDILYDGNGNATSTGVSGVDQVLRTYDLLGRMTREEKGAGDVTEYVYDALGRVVEIRDGVGVEKSYVYGMGDQPVSVTWADGQSATYTRDAAGRVTRIDYADGSSETVGYDDGGALTSITGRDGETVQFVLDARMRITRATYPNGETVEATWNNLDRMVSLKDARGNVTTFGYDDAGNRNSVTYADGTTETIEFNTAGQQVKTVRRDGTEILYEHNELGLITLRDYPGDTHDDSYSYDAAGRLVSATNYAGTVQRTYDGFSRIASETFRGRTTSYLYDSAALTRTVTYPTGRQVQEAYDGRERIQSIVDNFGTTFASYAFDSADLLQSRTAANGTVMSVGYTPLGDVDEIAHSNGGTDLWHVQYGFDAMDNVTVADDLVRPSESMTFAYDVSNRLVGYAQGSLSGSTISAPVEDAQWTLDTVGNWQTLVSNGVSENRTVGALNEYLSIGANTPVHDANGALTAYDGKAYQYGSSGRLERVASLLGDTTLATFQYDAIGRLATVTDAAGVATELVQNDRLATIVEYVQGAVAAEYVHGVGVDDPLAMIVGSDVYTYHQDRTGNVVALSDESGAIVERYLYSPYGETTILDGAGNALAESSVGNALRYAGRRYVDDAELYTMRARWYSPDLGRFLTEDPSGYVDGINLREYVSGSPTNYTDPFGLAKAECNVGFKTEIAVAEQLQKKLGKFLGSKLGNVKGKIYVEEKVCTQKCCTNGAFQTVTYIDRKFAGSAGYSSPYVPIPGYSIPWTPIGSIGFHTSFGFSVGASGEIKGNVAKDCSLSYSGQGCFSASGALKMFAGLPGGQSPWVDEFKFGVEGQLKLTGKICYNAKCGVDGDICLGGDIVFVASFSDAWIEFEFSYEIISGELFCLSSLLGGNNCKF